MTDGITMPFRNGLAFHLAEMEKLEVQGYLGDLPDQLPLSELEICPIFFQQRGTSLLYRAGASSDHVDTLARVVSGGSLLDPIGIVAFGPQWFLIDGHHRREAYLQAEYTGPVPVEVYTSDLRGKERIVWASCLSAELNSKNKLAMSEEDKSDTAWRLCVLGVLSKRETAAKAGVSTSSVGNMRKALSELTGDGKFSASHLFGMRWSVVRYECARLKGADETLPPPDLEERKLRLLLRNLSPAIDNRRPPVSLLLRALEELRPGIRTEITTYLEGERQLADAADLLDI